MKIRSAALLPVLALALAACGSSTGGSGDGNGLPVETSGATSSGGRLSVVAGENMWGNIAAQIGGSAVSVHSILSDPNVDPHEYESSVSDAASVAHANLVIANGVGYDDFLKQLLKVGSASGRVVLTVADIVHVSDSNPNPHLWYSPDYVTAAAKAIANELSRQRPADAAMFATNLATFLAGENKVVTIINQIKAKYAGAKVAFTEPVPGYLVDAAGLVLGIPASYSKALEEGQDPSPADAAAFTQALKDHTVKVLLYNTQVVDDSTKQLKHEAQSHGVPVVGVTETMPTAAANFQTWQADQAQALLVALGG